MTAEVMVIATEAGQAMWPEVREHVQLALVRDRDDGISIEEVGDQIGKGHAKLVMVVEDGDILGVGVVQLYVCRGERILHLLAVTGSNMVRWIDAYLDQVERLAVQEKANAITLNGRPGWSRKLARYGYHTNQVFMRKEVTP